MSAIVITASLQDDSIRQSAERTKSVFSRVFADLEKQAERIGQRLGGLGAANAGQSRTQQIAREQLAELNHQRKLVEIHERGQTQIDVARERSALREAERLRRTQQQHEGFFNFLKRNSSTIREAGESIQAAGSAISSVTTKVFDLGRAAVQAAVDFDKPINTLKAFLGSADAAEKRFAELVALSRKTPGLTADLAATLDAQLRVSNVRQGTIDRILPVIGKLNAIQPLGDPQKFAGNLVQLVTQNFERTDLKELVGNSPFAGQLIQQLFAVDSPTNARAIRDAAQRLGIKTVDEFFSALADTAAKNDKLNAATEGLASRFQKLTVDIKLALRPLGLAIIETLEPLVAQAVPIIQKLSEAFRNLDPDMRKAIVVVGLFVGALGPAIFLLGSFIQTFGALGNLATVVGGAAGLGGIAAGLTILGSVITGAIVEVVALYQAYQSNIGGIRDLVREFVTQATTFWARYGDFIKGTARGIWEFVKIVTAEQLGAILQTVNGILQILNGDWRKGLGNLITGAKNVLSGLPGALLEIGKNAAQGLIDGAKAKGAEVSSTFATMARIAIQASQGTFQTKSPSKVFFDIGQDVGAGLVLGLQARQGDVAKASSALAKSSIDEARKVQADLVALLGASPETLQRRADVATAQEHLRLLEEILEARRKLELPIADALPRTLQAARVEAERLRDALNGVELPRLVELKGGLPSPLPQGIPGGDIPTPKAVLGAAKALADIPPPPIIRELSEGERFAKGFASAIESVGDVFERFGQNVSRALFNVKDLFRNIAQSFKTLFLDLVGSGLQNLVGSTLGALFGRGGNNQAANGGGIGGFFRNFFGGNNSLSSAFRTPSFNPSASGGASNFFSQLSGLNFGISAPSSITGNPATVAASATRIGANAVNQATSNGGLFSRTGGFTSSLFGGAGGALFPLLGFGLGSSIGGQSGLGRILGGIGGGAIGLGLSYGASVFGALGGGLGALGPAALAALGPIALIGAPLLVGALLLGRAKQRRQDEQTSGDSLQRAIDGIRSLRRDVQADRVTSEKDARNIFEGQILAQFITEINQLKSKSVRESRLRNQVPDLRRLFENEVIPELVKQATRQIVNSKLIPEFATGVFGTKEGLAYLHDGEAVLNRTQQAALVSRTNPAIFQQIGVPKAPAVAPNGIQSFATGGFYTASPSGGSLQPIVVNVDSVTLAVTEDEAGKFIAQGVSTSDGRDAVFNAVRVAQRR